MKNTILLAAVIACSHVSTSSKALNTNPVITVSKVTAPAFSFLRGHRQGKAISLTWGVSSHAGIYSFDVESTYEDPNDPYAVWEMKGTVSCGNNRSFRFMDNNVLPGRMHYRIVARMADGSSVTSNYETIRIVSH
jgi:hypothetical protein